MSMDNSQTLWSSRYSRRRGRVVSADSDQWLERWHGVLDNARSGNVLELGCGGGRDTRYLVERGLRVIAGDFSKPALITCYQCAPSADIRQIDIRSPLPFVDGEFPIIIASLCLHYFSWLVTMKIMEEIKRCLKTGGFLLMRVNSTGDRHFGAVGHPEVEPDLYLVNGELKRFFDREAVERLATGWKVHTIEELTIHRYDSPKVVWEIVVEKE
jgi:SAM-dependent methyltransferase